MTLSAALRAYAAERKRSQFRPTSDNRYGRELERFAAHVGPDTLVSDLGAAECRSFLATFDSHASSTINLDCTIMSSFFAFLVLDDVIDANPMAKVRRPKNVPLRDRKRTRIKYDQVQQMLREARDWPERMCLSVLAYMGVRRNAASMLRWRDVDAKRWSASFHEKGGKVISKPIAVELREVLKQRMLERALAGEPISGDEYVIPNKRPARTAERSNKIIWLLVKEVAARCGIDAHCHAFRAAFAVHFLRTHPDHLEACRQLLGHASMQTTLGYLDELEGEEAMRLVETLSFAGERQLAVSA